jgi:hypothetical protein
MFEDDEPINFQEAYQTYMAAVRKYALTVNKDNIRHRFSELLPAKYTSTTRIGIVGAGSIGGWTARMLAKLGFINLAVYDDDTVEEHNVGTQPYELVHIGMPKVEALRDMIIQDCGFEITTYNMKVTTPKEQYDFLIFAVDSIETRRIMYDYCTMPTIAIIDPRMSLGTWNCLILPTDPDFRPIHKAYKQEHLFTAAEAVQEPCTARSIVDTPCTVAAYIAATIRYMVLNGIKPGIMDMRDTTYKFKWVKSFNALEWQSLTASPELLHMQIAIANAKAQLAQIATTEQTQPQTTQTTQQTDWTHAFNVGSTVIVRGGRRVLVESVHAPSNTFKTDNNELFSVTDVRGWS